MPEGNIWPWGSAALGFALPIGNGAAVAAPDRRVIAFMGDGGFGFTAMELATAVRYGLNVTVVIHNDDAFSSIANYQRVVHGRTYECDLTNPDFVAFAKSFGARARRVERWEDAARGDDRGLVGARSRLRRDRRPDQVPLGPVGR